MGSGGSKWVKQLKRRKGGVYLPIQSQLVGTFSHTVDVKGRIHIPATFREVLGEELVITRSTNKALMIFSQQGFTDFIFRFTQGPMCELEDIQYYFMGNAHKDSCDKQGRVVIPVRLRGYADIQKDVVVIGMGHKIEMWSTEVWEEKMQTLTPTIVAQKIKEARL